ncbi:MAG TPA: flavin prenyltransferase UbiX [Burkholderiales bacterium]|jgi:flavin prenyltransferase|nr:flavin prenyltransferase UbiX [Burkholderiales bacterium]
MSAFLQRAATVTVGLTGASGLAYGLRLIECLLDAGAKVGVIYSQAAQIVAKQEMDLVLPTRPQDAVKFFCERYDASVDQIAVYGRDDWYAPIASGSNPADAMVICPCSMGTLGAVAAGLADNLIERAADVALKERRKLVLVPRETPFSLLHLENMTRLARAGAVILPANPGFYHRPQYVEDLVDYVVARILDHLGIQHALMTRWGRSTQSETP